MSANYPASAPSFTPIVDGVDYPQSPQMNQVYDEVTAIGQALVTDGLAHDVDPDATANGRDLGSTAKQWEQIHGKLLNLADASELTIATGIITVTQSYHKIDTESDAASDDLVTITAGSGLGAGALLVVRAENVARVVTLKDGGGNLLLNGDYALNATDRLMLLIYDGTNWREVARSVETVTAPLQCSVYNSATQAVATATPTALTFDTEDHDTGSLHAGGSPSRITIPSTGAGLYLIGGATKIAQIATTIDASIYIRKNGTTAITTEGAGGPNGASLRQSIHTGGLVVLADADYIELIATQNSGGNINFGGASRETASQFWAVRMR